MGNSSRTYLPPGPCANCGKPGAGCKGSSRWTHSAFCCSDVCGYEYDLSPDLASRRWVEHEAAVQHHRAEARRWKEETQRYARLGPFRSAYALVRVARDADGEVECTMSQLSAGGWYADHAAKRLPTYAEEARRAWLRAVAQVLEALFDIEASA